MKNEIKDFEKEWEKQMDFEESILGKLLSFWRDYIKNPVKWFMQRRIRGFDDVDIWDLSFPIAKFIYPRLKAFKLSERSGIPCGNKINILCTEGTEEEKKAQEDWETKLDKMLEAFNLLANPDVCRDMVWKEADKSRQKRVGKKELKKRHADIDVWFDDLNNPESKYNYSKEESEMIDRGFEKERKIKEEGLKLFAEYFESLAD